jgi:hypothetical protein
MNYLAFKIYLIKCLSVSSNGDIRVLNNCLIIFAFKRTAACIQCSGARTTASASQRCVHSCVGVAFDHDYVRTH